MHGTSDDITYSAEALLGETVQQHLSRTGLLVLSVCSTSEEACMPVSTRLRLHAHWHAGTSVQITPLADTSA